MEETTKTAIGTFLGVVFVVGFIGGALYSVLYFEEKAQIKEQEDICNVCGYNKTTDGVWHGTYGGINGKAHTKAECDNKYLISFHAGENYIDKWGESQMNFSVGYIKCINHTVRINRNKNKIWEFKDAS